MWKVNTSRRWWKSNETEWKLCVCWFILHLDMSSPFTVQYAFFGWPSWKIEHLILLLVSSTQFLFNCFYSNTKIATKLNSTHTLRHSDSAVYAILPKWNDLWKSKNKFFINNWCLWISIIIIVIEWKLKQSRGRWKRPSWRRVLFSCRTTVLHRALILFMNIVPNNSFPYYYGFSNEYFAWKSGVKYSNFSIYFCFLISFPFLMTRWGNGLMSRQWRLWVALWTMRSFGMVREI